MNDQDPFLDDAESWEERSPSKSERKRQMAEYQAFADQLARLPEHQLLAFGCSPELVDSLMLAARLKSSNARNRQLRHASKLLYKSETEVLDAAQAFFTEKQAQAESIARNHHLVEHWRDQLLAEPDAALTRLIVDYPAVDRQEIRSLVRSAAREKQQSKSPVQQRKLFRYLRDQVIQ